MNLICKIKVGSHLYGTDTPDSDEDFKGVFMPELNDILLGRIPKQFDYSTNKTGEKNTKEDTDY